MNDLNTTVTVGSARRPDSTWTPRVSEKQLEAIERGLRGKQFDLENLAEYVAFGDAACLTEESTTTLRVAVKQAKVGLSESQAKRIWPRKVAAVAVQIG